eukprot:3319322-Rhodomonas_salina.1
MSLPSAAALPTSTVTLGISQQHAEALRSFPGLTQPQPCPLSLNSRHSFQQLLPLISAFPPHATLL